jgi:signal transduction histidine kinase
VTPVTQDVMPTLGRTTAGASTPAQRTGAGRGLRNLRERAEALGGRVAIHSRPGEGTTVRIMIPAERRAPSWAPTKFSMGNLRPSPRKPSGPAP